MIYTMHVCRVRKTILSFLSVIPLNPVYVLAIVSLRVQVGAVKLYKVNRIQDANAL